MIINEAYFAWGDAVSDKAAIDTAMKLGTITHTDLLRAEKIGLKNIYTLLATLGKTDNRYTPCSGAGKRNFCKNHELHTAYRYRSNRKGACFVGKDGLLLQAMENDQQKDHAAFVQTGHTAVAIWCGYFFWTCCCYCCKQQGPVLIRACVWAWPVQKGLCYALNKPLIAVTHTGSNG